MKVQDIYTAKGKIKKGYQALEISAESRSRLAGIFPPKFTEFVGHHITYRTGVPITDPLPEVETIKIVGYACNDEGIECLVAEVDGTTERPDGRTFHITWSLDREAGFKPVNSNELLVKGFEKIDSVINITATANFF